MNTDPAAPQTDPANKGVLPSQSLVDLIRTGRIKATDPIDDEQIQPASLDLRLGDKAYRVRASFLPGKHNTVADRIGRLAMHEFDMKEGAVLERGCVYIVPLMESVNLPEDYSAIGNPKSSTGRLDVFTRLITDHGVEFDQVKAGYHGPLYAEIAPRTFSVLVRKGTRLNQLRVRRGMATRSDAEHIRLQEELKVIDAPLTQDDIKNGVPITVDVAGDPETGLIGYRAQSHTGLIDMDKKNHYDPRDFWEPMHRSNGPSLILDPGEFYILASKEAVRVPTSYAAEMIAYDTLVGEFRVHYAGFFDPGFGHPATGGAGSRGVLEVRCYEAPFALEHCQMVGRLVYERMAEVPDLLYGAGIGSTYQGQELRLAKHFQMA
jgi:dCTP deaminase